MYLETMTQICSKDLLIPLEIKNLNKTDFGGDCVEIMKKLAPPMKDVISNCYFGNSMKKCDEIFSETITDDGLCYTFNVANSDQIFNENS